MRTRPTLLARKAAGSMAKLPVTSSRPKTTIMAKPSGKRTAPTTGGNPWAVAVKATVVAKPNRAPERKPRTSNWLTDSCDLVTALVRKTSATSESLT